MEIQEVMQTLHTALRVMCIFVAFWVLGMIVSIILNKSSP